MTVRTTRALRIAAGSDATALVMRTVSLVGTANAAGEADSTAAGATGTATSAEPAARVDPRIGGADR